MLSKSIYLFISKAVGYGIRILLPIFLVRLLTKPEFGAYNQFFLLEILIQTVFQMGICQSLYYFVPRDEENAGAYLLNSLMMNVAIYTVAYTIIWFFRDLIAHQLGMRIIYDYFWYLACYSLFVLLNVSVVSYLTARQKILNASILTILFEVLASIGTLTAAFLYRDLQKIILAPVIARGVSFLIGASFVHFRLHGFRSRRYFFGIMAQLRYGVVLGFGGTIWVYSLRLHELMVSRNFDIGTYAVYAAGCKRIPLLQFFSQSIAAVALGQFALLVKEGKWKQVQALWDKILGIMYGAAVPLVVVLLLVSRPLVLAMFTPEYAAAVPIFRWNVLAYLAMLVNSTLILRALDRNDVTVKVNGAMFLVLPFALYGGMKVAGLEGIIAVHVLAQILSRLAAQTYLRRLSPVPLGYLPTLGSLRAFYTGSFRKVGDIALRVRERVR